MQIHACARSRAHMKGISRCGRRADNRNAASRTRSISCTMESALARPSGSRPIITSKPPARVAWCRRGSNASCQYGAVFSMLPTRSARIRLDPSDWVSIKTIARVRDYYIASRLGSGSIVSRATHNRTRQRQIVRPREATHYASRHESNATAQCCREATRC